MNPSYTSFLALQAAKQRIINPPEVLHQGVLEPRPYEHHVGTWACTMLKQVFNSGNWAITPEKADQYSKKKPDLFVEEIVDNKFRPHLMMELKSNDKKIRFEDALHQVVKEIQETMEEVIECFVIVQCGTRIGFFEYHNDQTNLDEEDIPHLRGCVSLTQSYMIQGRQTTIMTNKPNDLLPIFHNYEKLRKSTDVRKEAKEYKEKCVFDLEKHENYIYILFHHIARSAPRSSV